MVGMTYYHATNNYVRIPFPFAQKLLTGKTVTVTQITVVGTTNLKPVGNPTVNAMAITQFYEGQAYERIPVECMVKIE